jgi:hypothetical protein
VDFEGGLKGSTPEDRNGSRHARQEKKFAMVRNQQLSFSSVLSSFSIVPMKKHTQSENMKSHFTFSRRRI